jgi:hypothetical protein
MQCRGSVFNVRSLAEASSFGYSVLALSLYVTIVKSALNPIMNPNPYLGTKIVALVAEAGLIGLTGYN